MNSQAASIFIVIQTSEVWWYHWCCFLYPLLFLISHRILPTFSLTCFSYLFLLSYFYWNPTNLSYHFLKLLLIKYLISQTLVYPISFQLFSQTKTMTFFRSWQGPAQNPLVIIVNRIKSKLQDLTTSSLSSLISYSRPLPPPLISCPPSPISPCCLLSSGHLRLDLALFPGSCWALC